MATITWTEYIIGIVVALLIAAYFSYRDKTKAQIVSDAKHLILKLFLYAEKQDWVGPDKMLWCIDQAVTLLPAKAQKIILSLVNHDTIESWVQELYEESKKQLETALQ